VGNGCLWQHATGEAPRTQGITEEEDSDISPAASTKDTPGRRPGSSARRPAPSGPARAGTAARVIAGVALAAAIVVVALVVLSGGSDYTVHADFQDASGLVTGDSVLIGPAVAGTVTGIGLTDTGEARVTLKLNGDVGALRQGTMARIAEDSLSGIASKYVLLEPGPAEAQKIVPGGLIRVQRTRSEVNLDAVFDTLDPSTRTGLKNLIRGEAASLQGRGREANQALKYLAPGLQSTSDVTAELARDQPTFDHLVVQGAQAMQALASRSQQLSQLIANTSTATGAIANQSQALTQALTLFPGTLRRATTTLAGLDSTLDALDPLVAASKPAARRLPQFVARLNTLLTASIPTVAELNDLIRNPAGTGDLTQLARQTPALERIAAVAFPQIIKQFNDSQAQVQYLRQYTPDVVAALANIGQASANYDANGHFVRSQPTLYPFTLDGQGQLTMQFPSKRYQGLQAVRNRCPGSAVQPTPDGSAPQSVSGCQTTSVPPGP
jgi:phospholipid/cholesterol/gamma-HCH transport system substrate-binding protein